MESKSIESLVSVRQIDFEAYPTAAPFDPDTKYAEYDFAECSGANHVYESVRSVLHDMELDSGRFGTKDWSPFSDLIQPGDRVVIKPNLVIDADLQEAVTTHASVIRPVVDYAWKALQGEGELTICDAPVVEADFEKIVERNGLKEMVEILNNRGYRITLEDLRARRTRVVNNIIVGEIVDPGRISNAVAVDLRGLSFFEDPAVKLNKLSDGSYFRRQIAFHHQKGTHIYPISKKILDADVVISIPKLKTHKKSGITCCLKNLVGINVDKNHLPHFTLGPANLGGDEFPPLPAWRIPLLMAYKLFRLVLLGSLHKLAARPAAFFAGIFGKLKFQANDKRECANLDTAQKVYQIVTGTDYAGSWSGNETIWRMILDLNRIFMFADAAGNISPENARKTFYVVDGFIAGVKNGPLTPQAARAGIVAVGFNAALVDKAILELAGIDARRIPLYREALSSRADWLHEGLELQIKMDGVPLVQKRIAPHIRLEGPTGWDFQKADEK